MDLLRNMYEKNKYQINFGNKRELFDVNDPIFNLEGQTKQVFPANEKCISCDKEIGKNKKLFWYVYFFAKHFSHFCGYRACEKCAHKKRAFANQKYTFKQMKEMSILKIQKECTMGIVCRICDRKFFLRLTYQEYANELMQLEAMTDQVQTEL